MTSRMAFALAVAHAVAFAVGLAFAFAFAPRYAWVLFPSGTTALAHAELLTTKVGRTRPRATGDDDPRPAPSGDG